MRNRSIWKRVMAWTMILAMTVSTSSMAALAEEVPAEQQTEASAGAVPDEQQTEAAVPEQKTEQKPGQAEVEEPKELNVHEHTLEHVAAKDPTCTEAGNKEYWKCTDTECGKLFSDSEGSTQTTQEAVTLPMVAHTLEKVEAKDSTCMEEGNTEHWKCTVCGKLFSNSEGTTETTQEAVTISKKPHNLTAVTGKEATCTADGHKDYWYCSACGNYFLDDQGQNLVNLSELILKAGHKLTAVAEKPETCTEDGNKAYWHCTVCDKYFADEKAEKEITLEETVLKAGHKLTAVAEKAATSTATGNIAHWYCSRCKKYYLDEKAEKETTLEAVTIAMLPMSAAEISVNSVSLNNKMKVVWSGSRLKATWGMVEYADGYEIYGKKRGGGAINSSHLLLTVGSGAATSAVISEIGGNAPLTGTNYKFQIKAYRMVDGKKEYIATGLVVHVAGKTSVKYTNVAKVKADASGYAMPVGTTRMIYVTVTKKITSKKLLPKSSVARTRFLSTNTGVATVSSSGLVTAVGKGTCYVYVKAANGRQTKIRITVY